MKLIKVIMRPEKTFELKDVLSGIGYHGITVKECSGFGEHKTTIKQLYRGIAYDTRSDLFKRVELEFIVHDDKVESIVKTIRNVASTDKGGDGRIYIIPVEDAIHIHSGDTHSGFMDEKLLESKRQ
ncbi:MAG: P-II family nitrogen regulator [Planctomycetes bacterium]|nr:P-II family nitrogen regulator [Planctomycetota bacterium]